MLTGRSVEDIHLEGGSILGTSSIAPDYRCGVLVWLGRSLEVVVCSTVCIPCLELSVALLCVSSPSATSPKPLSKIVRMIDLMGLDMLFVIGGAGGHMGATQLEALLTQHGVRCVVVGVPKSIDNSILLVGREAVWGEVLWQLWGQWQCSWVCSQRLLLTVDACAV